MNQGFETSGHASLSLHYKGLAVDVNYPDAKSGTNGHMCDDGGSGTTCYQWVQTNAIGGGGGIVLYRNVGDYKDARTRPGECNHLQDSTGLSGVKAPPGTPGAGAGAGTGSGSGAKPPTFKLSTGDTVCTKFTVSTNGTETCVEYTQKNTGGLFGNLFGNNSDMGKMMQMMMGMQLGQGLGSAFGGLFSGSNTSQPTTQATTPAAPTPYYPPPALNPATNPTPGTTAVDQLLAALNASSSSPTNTNNNTNTTTPTNVSVSTSSVGQLQPTPPNPPANTTGTTSTSTTPIPPPSIAGGTSSTETAGSTPTGSLLAQLLAALGRIVVGAAQFIGNLFSGSPSPSGGATTSPTVQGQDVSIGSGSLVQPGDTASILYVAKLQDGTVFDSSAAHGNAPLTFELGTSTIISGLQIGVNGMRVGGERLLSIPPELGYGSQTITDANGSVVIPKSSTLIFDVTLVGMQSAASTTPNK